MKNSIVSILVVLCIVCPAITTYYFISEIKQSEIDDLTTQYQLQKECIGDLEGKIKMLNVTFDDWQDFDKLIVKGLREIVNGGISEGYADSDYDNAGANYEVGYFDVAKTYADSADIYYTYASDSYRAGKAYLIQAKNIATNNKTRQLAELYVNMTELGAQTMDELHQANEYFSSACNCYNNGWWELEDIEIEKMNDHIEAHDEIVPTFNDCYFDIDALLDTF